MKKILVLAAFFAMATNMSVAQGNGKAKNADKGKNKEKVEKVNGNDKNNDKDKDKVNAKDKEDKVKQEKGIWEGTSDKSGGGPKPSKNQPTKVKQSFYRDYPNASNVSWSKYRGDWTATFRNGLFMSTAVYHANGDRRDTRTQMNKEQVPIRILDIFKKRPETKVEDAVKIEVPKSIKDIFRIKTMKDGSPKFEFFDADGMEVQYNY